MINPYYKIMIGKANLVSYIGKNLIEFRYNDRSGSHIDSLELDIADTGILTMPRAGVEMDLVFGYEDERPRFEHRFTIDQVEHSGPPPCICLSATTADFTSQAHASRERSHRSITLGELIEKLASEHGYSSKVIPDELARVHLDHVDQAGQSDLALAWEVARSHDAIFKPVNGIWFVRSFEALGDPTATIRPSDVSSWRAHFVAQLKYASVKAHYHNYDTAERVPVVVGEGEPQLLLDATYVDEGVARWQAKAAAGRARRASRKLALKMPGRPDLSSQQVIRLEGFRDNVDDIWLITDVVHTMNKSGYTSSVECEGV